MPLAALPTLGLVLLSLLAPAARGAARQGPVLEGRVLDSAGQPAAGAHVFLAGNPVETFASPDLFGRAEVGEDGGFRFTVPERWVRGSEWMVLYVYALRAGDAAAVARLDAADLPIGESFDVRLGALAPEAQRRVLVLGPDGAPVAGARVQPRNLGLSKTTGVPLAEIAAEIAEARTGDDGVAVPMHWNPKDAGTLRVTAGSYGTQQVSDDFGRPGWFEGELELHAADALELVFVDTDLPSDFVFEARTWVQTDGPNGLQRAGYARVRPDESGALLHIIAGPPMNFGGGHPALLACGVRYEDRAAGAGKRMIVEGKGVATAVGRIVDAAGAPVPGLELTLHSPPFRAVLTTDAQGRFAVRAKAGPLRLSYGSDLDRSGSNNRKLTVETDADEVDFGDIVQATAPVTGTVLLPSGEPAPGAWVSGSFRVSFGGGGFTNQPVAGVADASGRFRIDAPADQVVDLSARFASLFTSEPVKAHAGGASVELRLAEFVAPRGHVADVHGQPLADVEVVVWKSSPEGVRGGERKVAFGSHEKLVTDAQGAFAGASVLDPDGRYCVTLSGPGVIPARVGWTSGAELAAGFDVEAQAARSVSGRVVDPYGKPVAGARVASRPGLLAAVETTTAADGTFTLDGVAPGGGFLFCEDAHGNFDGIYDAGGGELEWTFGETIDLPEAPRASARTPRARELEIAHEILKVGLARALEGDGRPYRVLSAMAWVDPSFVLDELRRGTVEERLSGIVVNAVVRSLASKSPDEALAVAELNDSSYSSSMGNMWVFDELPDADRERKLEILALAYAKVRQVSSPAHRVVLYGWVGRRLLALGEREAAEAVLTEGQGVARDLPTEEWAAFARCSFAEELAVVDLDAALELLAGDVNRHYGNIAHKLAGVDPQRAEELLKRIGSNGSWRRDRFVPRMAYAMAPIDLERALALAEKEEPSGFTHGMIALALVREEQLADRRERVSQILADAFDRVEAARDSREQSWAYPPARVAGALLAVAAEVEAHDAERLESYVWRAVAICDKQNELNHLGAGDSLWQNDGVLAFYVERFDRELALRLLEPVIATLLKMEGGELDWEWRPVWAALAVIDPERALELSRSGELPADALRTIGDVLGRTGDERRRFVQDEYVNLWIVGKEDI
ncbi:MAG: hypothetical protein GY711_04640 [bacterium]|nr:hypothetical protein [bacterium]